MELTGALGSDDRKIYETLLVPLDESLTRELMNLPQNQANDVLLQIYQGLGAITISIMTLCEQPRTSSQATASLMRTLIEGCLTAFAFCREPIKQAELYVNFRAVLDYRFACCQERHFGCPLVTDTHEDRLKIAENREKARKVLETVGLDYLKEKPDEERLQAALSKGNHKAFRDKWYSGTTPRDLLKEEGMEWVYDVLYVPLCSAVHSDSAASMVFKFTRDIVFTWSWWIYSAAVYRLVETFQINLPEEQMRFLRQMHAKLQHKPSI